MGALALEEAVAGGAETFPEGIGMTARNGADFFPAGLQGDKVRRWPSSHSSLFINDSAASHNSLLSWRVMVHFGFEPGEEPTLNVVELVARGAEPFVNPGIVFLGREADGLPGLLNGEQPFAGAVPLLAGGERGCESSSSQAAQSSVLSSRFFSCSAFRASKYSWCSLLTREEAALKRSHKVSALNSWATGPVSAPLVVELLQPAGSLDDRRFEQQRLGLLAQRATFCS